MYFIVLVLLLTGAAQAQPPAPPQPPQPPQPPILGKHWGGGKLSPEDDLKMTAARSLMESTPDRAIPLVEKLLARTDSPGVQHQALDILTNSQHPKAREITTRAAKGEFGRDLQIRALRRLGGESTPENLQLLESTYKSATDPAVKSAVLSAYMAAGDAQRLIAIAKSDSNTDLRRRAVQYLSHMKNPEATNYLVELLK
ncbi:MAG: hypothetical protein JNK87_35495 [Bryobacterales bacterium]|nr:hypothetical protein [Bryobacterales bacterium]